ncbi:MAG: membrane protein insertion efficiency factor YidD [Candidatus Gracilibacteria bacterium]|nr:membrane protein insertion efficiency factor YidD [Candidatus Gracilibacteria bacterium]
MKKILIYIIGIYQRYLSPDHSIWSKSLNKPPYCRYTPSCSDYMKESIEKRGAFIGILKGTWRILRCNPLSKGGYDPVEKELKKRK